MPETEINEAFLREVLTYIELHQENWNQGHWANTCGTSHCLAGWAYVLGTGKDLTASEIAQHGEGFVIDTAAKLLGLNLPQAFQLFYFTMVGERRHMRRPTFAEFCAKVEEVTGVKFKPVVELEMVDA